MDVASTCPIRVSSVTWQPWAGVWAFTVVCKATFRLEPGTSQLAEAQDAPAEDEIYWEGDRSKSLFAPSDLAPFKARADVLLVGHAFAPRRQPARSLIARLAVGELDKRVEVWCDRIFWHQGQVLEGSPFVKMPLRYELAAGGPETWNPVGMRLDAPPDARGAVSIPNLQPPGVRELRPGTPFAPVGFGPIAPSWPERAMKLPRGAAGWSHEAWREQPLPKNFDQAYFNAAPRDQQVASIRLDERITLENLHPDYERLETKLPGVRPRASVSRGGRAAEEVPLTCDTLWIDTDRSIVTAVWRGRVGLSHPSEAGQVVVSMEAPEGAGAGAWFPPTAAALGGETASLPGGDPDDATAVLTPEGEASARSILAAEVSEESGTIVGAVGGGPLLPFGPARSPWAVFPQKATSSAVSLPPEDTGTAIGARSTGEGALPFLAEERRASWPPAPPPPGDALIEEPTKQPAQAVIEPLTAYVAEPAPEPVTSDVAVPVVEPAPTATPAVTEELPVIEYPLERCAAIAASIDRNRAETSGTLEANKLDAETWAALDQHWNEVISEEIGRGKTTLLRAYDAAYVAQLEAERGPIQAPDYARLVVAAERGKTEERLAEMSLPRAAVVRIERVWLGKIADDPSLGKSVKLAIKTARSE